MINKLCYEL